MRSRSANVSVVILYYSLFAVIKVFSASAFQQQHQPICRSFSHHTKFSSTVLSSSSSSASFASADNSSTSGGNIAATPASNVITSVRTRLREATGFSFTVFRATLRGVTGISLTTLYAATVAASGLWIRKTMSVLLSIFPSGFRYFLQPFLIVYYTPLILLRSWTGPARKNAAAKHETVVEAWKEAVTVAKQAERDGYWPVVVSDDGYFELNKPPSVNDNLDNDEEEKENDVTTAETKNAKLADAMAVAVEQAMGLKENAGGDNERK